MKDDACERSFQDLADRPRFAAAPVVMPDPARMRRWLASAPVGPDGAVLSWVNERHPGHAYCEAAGLWLSHACDASGGAATTEDTARVAEWLASQVGPAGGVGRDGRVYAFDSAVALRGLLAWRRTTGSTLLDGSIRALHGFLARSIEDGVAVRPPTTGFPRWSERFAPHLLKVALALEAFSRAFGDLSRPLLDRLAERAGAWPVNGEPVYVHAFCYAIEGRLVLARLGIAKVADRVDEAFDRLATFQRADGGLPAYGTATPDETEARCDATAQAVRLWILSGASLHADRIRPALGFLARQQAAAGGLRYSPGCDDLNVWTTIFSAQAVDWATRGGADVLDLI